MSLRFVMKRLHGIQFACSNVATLELIAMKMGLREANQNFGKAIRAVKAGKVVVLTERGEPIATIQPVHRTSTVEDVVQQLIREGLLRPALGPGSITDDWKPLRIEGVSLSKTLRELRDEE